MRQIGGIVAGMVGSMLGGPMGFAAATLGFGFLFPPKRPKQEGSRLTDLDLQTSDYGTFINEYYGKMQASGNIIDSRWVGGHPAGIEEVHTPQKSRSFTGRKPPAPSTSAEDSEYQYFLTAAFAWGHGPLDVDVLWWEDSKGKRVIYDRNGATPKARGYDLTPEYDIHGNLVGEISEGLELWRGLESQPVSAKLAAFHGGEVPAYRGISYTLLYRFQLTHGQGKLSALVRNAVTGRREIVESRLIRSGIPESRIDLSVISGDVHGAAVTQRESASILVDKICTTSLADIVPVDGLIKDRSRVLPVYWRLQSGDLAAHERSDSGGEFPDGISLKTVNVTELPSEIVIPFQDINLNYEINYAIVRRHTAAHENSVTVDLGAIAGTLQEFQRIGQWLLNEAWAAQETVAVSLLPGHIRIAPGDVLEIPDGSEYRRFRAGKHDIAPSGLMSYEGVSYDPGVYGQHMLVDQVPLPGPTVTEYEVPLYGIYDGVALTDPMADSATLLIWATTPVENAWAGAIFQSSELGNLSLPVQATSGSTLEEFTLGSTVEFEPARTLSVQLDYGELGDTTEDAAAAGLANVALVGGRVIAFASVTETSPGVWLLTGITDGLKGSDHTGTIPSGSDFVLLLDESGADTGGVRALTVPYPRVGTTVEYLVTAAAPNADASTGTQTLAVAGNSLRPLSPVGVQAISDGADGIALSWHERTRSEELFFETGVDPRSSDPLRFEVVLTNSGGTALIGGTKTVSAPGVVFTDAELSTVYGTAPATVYGRVRQTNELVGAGLERSFSFVMSELE